MKWSIDEFIKSTGGRLVWRGPKEGFESVSTDTRLEDQIPDSAFFALKSARDGHNFLLPAFQKGAGVLVVEDIQKLSSLKNKVTVIQVENTLKSLGRWAHYWRKKLKIKTAGITGSNGKTTTKHFLKLLLGEAPGVTASQKSYNNYLGVSLSLLSASLKTKILIQEIGTSSPGEIKELCALADPFSAVCTMVGPAHLKNFGSIKQVSLEKEQIYSSCSQGVFNLDQPWTRGMESRFQGSKITFSSQDEKADVCLKVQSSGEDSLTVAGKIKDQKGRCLVKIAGRQHLNNIMAAVGLALSLGCEPSQIWKKLHLLELPAGRGKFTVLKSGVRVFFDAYNANPQSMSAFLDHIRLFKTPLVLCLGDMMELGAEAEFFHRELGKNLNPLNLKHLCFIGKHRFDFEKGLKDGGFQGNYTLFNTLSKKSVECLLPFLSPPVTLALKASRGLKLEKLVEELELLSHTRN